MSAPSIDRRRREQITPVIYGTPHDYYRPRPPQTARAREAAARQATPVPAPRDTAGVRRVLLLSLVAAGVLVALILTGTPREVPLGAGGILLLLLLLVGLGARHLRPHTKRTVLLRTRTRHRGPSR